MIDLNLEKHIRQDDYKNFPIELLPDAVSEYISELRDKMGCNPNFMAASFLGVASICIDRSKSIVLKNSWREWCMLWVVIIGDAGSKKSPSTSAIMRPLKRIAHEKHKLFEAQKKAFTDDVSSDPPKLERFYTSDATIEQYINLHSQNKKGMAIIMGEISSLISNSGKYTGGKGSDIEKYLQAFSYEELSSDRKTATSSRLPNAHLTIFGGIQPTVLSGHMTAHLQDNGFWDRFLFVNGNGQTGYMTKEDVDSSIENNYDNYVTGLFELIRDSYSLEEEEDIPVNSYRMTKEAFDCWFDYNHHIEKLIGPESELSNREKSAYSKMATYLGRFILMFHVFDIVYVHPYNRLREADVQIESVEKGIKILKYFIHQYELVSADVSEKREAINILSDTKGMSNKEKAYLLRSKDPILSDRAIAKILNISNVSVSKYFKIQ